MRSTAWRWSFSSTWKIALCSLSTGSSRPPPRDGFDEKGLPAETRHSLLASAMSAPRRAAASVGPRPALPTIAAITQPASRSPPRSGRCARRQRRYRCRSTPPEFAVAMLVGGDWRAPRRRGGPAPQATGCCRCRSARATANRSRPPSRSTTSSVLVPIDPVEPSIVRRRLKSSPVPCQNPVFFSF